MGYGWIQKDLPRGGAVQLFDVVSMGTSLNSGSWDLPLWLKISVREAPTAPRMVEIAVQGYGDAGHARQLLYGLTLAAESDLEDPDTFISLPVAWDWNTAPGDPASGDPWPVTAGPAYLTFQIAWTQDIDQHGVAFVYYAEWWLNVLYNFTGALKTQLDLASWSQTTDAGYAAPDAVILVVDDDLDVNKVNAKLQNALVVIHGPAEMEPEPDFAGGHGREGREYHAKISLFTRTQLALSGSSIEPALVYAEYLAEDLKLKLAAVNNPNLLASWLYFSKLEMTVGPVRVPVAGLGGGIARVDFVFKGFKIQVEGEDAPASELDEGVVFNFNQGYIQGAEDKKQNDHGLIYIAATGLWHLIGIYSDWADAGSDYLTHYTSVDLRTWTQLSNVRFGTDTDLNWRAQVWAPHIVLNPNYGKSGVAAGCYPTYKYLAFGTGFHRSGGATGEQKIGLWGCLDDDLDTWAVLNSDAPIYWTGQDGGASWAYYPGGTGTSSASRDACMFTDGTDYYLMVTCVSDADHSMNCLGLAKFSGGTDPDWTDTSHEANPILTATYAGAWVFESSFIFKKDGLWHLFGKGYHGTRHQSGDTMFGPPWGTLNTSGVEMMNEGPDEGEASEVVPISGEVYACSGHNYFTNPHNAFWYKFNELDFTGVDTAGESPVPASMGQIPGLVGLREGAMDMDLRWTITDSEGASSAFWNQPVWNDQAAEAGYGASGMTGNSYIATRFRCQNPTHLSYYDGVEYSDNAKVGSIQSSSFTITRNRISLMVGGGNHEDAEFVAMVRVSDDMIIFKETGLDSHVMSERIWDLSDIIGLEVYLVVVDTATGSWGNISVDHIQEYYEDGVDNPTPPLPFAQSIAALLP